MTDDTFELRILDLHWLENMEEQNDYCLHGYVFLKIGNEVIIDENSFELSLSASSLFLMRTLKMDYKKNDFSNYLFPCCGHFFIGNEEKNFVIILGCNSGYDWTITHLENNKVKHISEKGTVAVIEFETYKNIVLDFADKIENFYNSSLTKVIPADEFEKNGYITFWNEWKALRNDWR